MNRLAFCTLAFVMSVSAVTAAAHGDWAPKHKGIMNNDLGEISFELVARGQTITVFLADHGDPIPTAGAKGTVTLSRGSSVWKAELTSEGSDRLTGRLSKSPKKEDRIQVNVTFSNGSIAEGRFLMK